jgi:hypothetical protein
MKQAVVILVVLCAVMFAAADHVDAQATGPTFSVENPSIDIGEIKAGSEAVATFVFRNDGPTDVKIIKAKPS